LLKIDENDPGISLFSKRYDDEFNPQTNFIAVMTCGDADEACPIVNGADSRIAVKYTDPKAYDNSPDVDHRYLDKSLEIASEMFFVFNEL
jgi:arsenate reductase